MNKKYIAIYSLDLFPQSEDRIINIECETKEEVYKVLEKEMEKVGFLSF